MKKYYIYLTILHHPKLGDLYYAGKNKSEGPEKDSKYRGSCSYRYWKYWIKKYDDLDPKKSLFQTRILAWFDTEKEEAKAESILIQKCLVKHGAFLYGTYKDTNTPRSWLDQFGKGTCLNGHWNDMSQCHTLEAIANLSATERANAQKYFLNDGFTGCCAEIAEHTGIKFANVKAAAGRVKEKGFTRVGDYIMTLREESPEAIEAWLNCVENNARTQWQSSGYKAACNPEVIARRAATRRANGPKYVLSDGFIGCAIEIAEHTGVRYGTVKAAIRRMKEKNKDNAHIGNYIMTCYDVSQIW